ncbi:hypothetical protein HUW51_10885 [Adhaeribacter swui]|uniref:DUF1440 domain-containing protein n=1 Tax=Adhaeribacter swui TaxID=2086471 RepID=A0A7G7G7S3_9BACT|nr:DUF6789 family protein [Adhaeribacter swui]QNF33207.1 hypothetical protein HUW51_10885 [Adhaeribacter swui]
MKLVTTIVAGIVGTTVMTAFSYAVSALKKENFKEPELLNLLLQNQPDRDKARPNHFAGWLLHYSVGGVWAGVYSLSLQALHQKPQNKQALVFGLISGVSGVLIWKSVLKLHTNPPKIAYQQFYQQLFLAHMLFAFATSKTLNYLPEKE